jgi:hypothetical protein
MKKLLLLIALFLVLILQAQDLQTINKMQSSSVTAIKTITDKLVNLTDKKFEFYKEKETTEYYLLVYIPVGLSAEQKEESRVNRYENGVVFRLSKTNIGDYKLKEFYAEPTLMFAIINSVFYPSANQSDFLTATKYRDYIDSSKGYKFYFYSGDSEKSKYRFYSY